MTLNVFLGALCVVLLLDIVRLRRQTNAIRREIAWMQKLDDLQKKLGDK